MPLSSLTAFMSSANPILLVVVSLGFVIFVHELGHFLTAKFAGVRVDAFSLGFGPILLHWKVGDTDYRLSLIPLGGYVKLAGESAESGAPPKPDELMAQPVSKRAMIFGAGVVMNMLTAFAMFIVAFRIGVYFPAAVVGGTEPGSPAWVAGLQAGDRILEINGNKDPDFEELVTAAALARGARGVSLVVERDGKEMSFELKPQYDTAIGVRLLGIERGVSLRVGAVLAFGTKENSPALQAGIEVGDRLMAVNDHKLTTWNDFRALCAASPGKPLTVLLERDGKELSVTLTPRQVIPYQVGVSGLSCVVRAVRRNSLSEQVGFAEGDKILSVNGTVVSSWMRFVDQLAAAQAVPIKIEVERKGKTQAITVPRADATQKARLHESLSPVRGLTVAEIVEGSPAAKAGLKAGDTLLTMNGKALRSWDDFVARVRANEAKPIMLTWERDGAKFGPLSVQPVPNEKAAYGEVGLAPMEERVLRKYGFWKSCTVGTHKAVLTVVQLYHTLVGLFSGAISPRNVGSIILIAQATYYSALEGIGKLLYFLGVLGINFAIINVFPIPVLDGGHLLFLVFEKIKGSPVRERTMSIAQYVGLVLILGLILFAVRNDILRILGSS